MPRIFFYSDPHFSHVNIIRYCNRPFKDVNEMNEKLIKKYNHLVGKNDIVYFLGDLGCSSQPEIKEIIQKLNGIKILISGNHDKWGINTYYQMGFSSVLEEAVLKRGKYLLTLRHFPQRNYLEIFRLFFIYYRKMREKNRPFWEVFRRLRNEWVRYGRQIKTWVICGHIHGAWLKRGKNINCSVEMWEYSPVQIDKVIRLIQEDEK